MNLSNRIPPGVLEIVKECNLEVTPELEEFVAKLGQRWLGLNTPFICGGSDDRDSMGLPKTLLICPAYGLDGFCVYEKKGEYTAPGW